MYTDLTEVAAMATHNPKQAWTVADAQANLEELLRLSETEGTQYIAAGKTFAVAPVADGDSANQEEPRMSLGKWLVENMPRGTNLVIPDDEPPEDENPWTDEGDG